MDRFIEFILQIWESIVPCTVLDEYERGVVLRWGRFDREIGPGFHWLFPPIMYRALTEVVVVQPHNLVAQSLTTSDDIPMVISAVITSRVENVTKLLLEVEGREQAISDVTLGVVASCVAKATYDEVRQDAFRQTVLKEVRRLARKYGVEVLNVQFSDLQRCRSLRLVQGS